MAKLDFTKFYAEHIQVIQAQPAQERERELMRAFAVSPGAVRNLEQSDIARTAWLGPTCVGCAGLARMWDGRAIAWALLSSVAGPHMREITREIVRVLDASRFDRVELTVDVNFEPAHRWAKVLGFELEAPRLRRYAPDGRDMALYARVRE